MRVDQLLKRVEDGKEKARKQRKDAGVSKKLKRKRCSREVVTSEADDSDSDSS